MPSRRRHTFHDHDRDDLLNALRACRDAVLKAGTAAGVRLESTRLPTPGAEVKTLALTATN